jgi:DNA-binding response OmpR family regulator
MDDLSKLLDDTYERKPLVLIVDDIDRNIQLLSLVLSKHNYEIASAGNGFQALELLEKISPDIILLDITMPGMDGFEVCTKLKANPATSETPVIFLTGRGSVEDINKGFSVGAVDYIAKPFNSEELLSRVKTHIELKSNHDIKDSLIELLQNTIERFKSIADLISSDEKTESTEAIAMKIEEFVRKKL